MNRYFISLIVAAAAFLPHLVAADGDPSQKPTAASPLEQKFRDGLYAEEAKQDLTTAAQAYRDIVDNYDRDRETASSALFRLGEVYRKQNKPKDAVECFRRVVREFPDREPLARIARENLKALGEPLPDAPGTAAPPQTDPEEDKALTRLRQLEKDSPDLILKPGTNLQSTGFMSYAEAAQAGYVKVVQWYLDHGASADATPTGECPLTIAASFGHLPLVSFLLEKGAQISGTKDHEYPLRAAAEKGHLAVAKLLLEKGADVNGRKYERTDEEGKKVTGWTNTPLAAASNGGHKAMVEFLLSQKADPNGENQEALFAAADDGETDLVIQLLKAGAQPGEATRTWRWREKQQIVIDPQSGVRRYVPPSGENRKIPLRLEEAPKAYTGAPVPYWADGYQGQQRKYPLLHFAVLSGDPRMVSALLDHKFPLDTKTSAGSTALEFAILVGKLEVAQVLLKAGADVKLAAPGGVRLIDFAIRRADEKLYALLREHGAVVSGRSPNGASALGVLQELGDYRIEFRREYLAWFERLLNDGADPNGDDTVRPVNLAASSGDLDMIRLLKAKGADFTPDNAAAPLPLVVEHEFTEKQLPVLKALIEAGADTGAISTAPPRVAYNQTQPRQAIEDMNLLAAAARHVPPLALLEKLLELKPVSKLACENVQGVYYDAKKELDTAAKAVPQSGQGAIPGQPSNRPVDLENRPELERIVAEVPAVCRRLWEYQWIERNEQIGKRIWLTMSDSKQSGMYKSFSPASPTNEPLSVVEALAWAYGPGSQELKPDGTRWEFFQAVPDFKNLVILRRDGATGKIKAREPVDLLALAEKGDASALPVLQPGDLLEGTPAPVPQEKAQNPGPPALPVQGWAHFPEPMLTFFKKVLHRSVAVKAGEWERKFQFAPWHPQFRWDPASDKLAIDPLLSQIIRYLPNPDYFYRMNAVRLVRSGQETRTFDLTKPPTLEATVILRDGDRIEIEALPADDPSLTARMKQGIFLSCPADGFLREVFHDPDTRPITDEDSINHYILRRFLAKSESLIPFADAASAKFVRASPDTVWGGRLEVSRGAATEGGWRAFDYYPAVQVQFTDGSASGKQAFWLGRAIFGRSGEIWTGGGDMLASNTLDEVVRQVTRNTEKTQAWGQWELRREGQEKPLAVFTPGKDTILQVFLLSGDSIKLSSADAAAGWPPPQATQPSPGAPGITAQLMWRSGGPGLTSNSTTATPVTSGGTPQPARRRVRLPSP